VYFFSSPKPSDRHVIIIIIVVVVVVVSSMTAVRVSSDDVDKSRGRNVKQHDEEDPDSHTHTHTHTHINMYKCVYAHKTTLSVCRRVVKQSHPAVCEGPFPGPKTPNNGFYTCKPQNKFRFRPPFVHCIIILLYCIRQWRLHSARFRPCLCIMRPMLQ